MLGNITKWIKRLILVAWLVLVCIIGSWLVTQNDQPLALSLLIFDLPELTAGLYMCLVFTVGGAVGFFTCFIGTQGSLFARNRALKKANQELNSLRNVQAKE